MIKQHFNKLLENKYLIILVVIGGLIRINSQLWIIGLNVDAIDYSWPAMHLIQGKGYTMGYGEIPGFRQPLLVLLMAGVYLIAGVNHYSARVPAIVAGILCPLVVYYATKEFFDKKAALYACTLAIINPSLISISGEVYRDSINTIFVLLILILGHRALKSKKSHVFAQIGVLLGLGYLMRSESILFLLLLGGYFIYNWKEDFKKLGKLLGILCIVLLILILPWIAYNYYSFGISNLESYVIAYQYYIHEFKVLPPRVPHLPIYTTSPTIYIFAHTPETLVVGYLGGLYRAWMEFAKYLTPIGFFLFMMGFLLSLRRSKLILHLAVLYYFVVFAFPVYIWWHLAIRFLATSIAVAIVLAGAGLSRVVSYMQDRLNDLTFSSKIKIPKIVIINLVIAGLLIGVTINGLVLEKDRIELLNGLQSDLLHRAGLWLKDHSEEDSIIATNFPNLIQQYSQRDTIDLNKNDIDKLLENPPSSEFYILVDSTCIQSDSLIEMYLYAKWKDGQMHYQISIQENVKLLYVAEQYYTVAIYKKTS